VRGQLAGKTARTRQKATAVGGTVTSQLQAKTAPVVEAMPEPVRRAVAKGARTAQQRQAPLAVATITLIAGYLVFRWWRKR
jgi:predicted deacylase